MHFTRDISKKNVEVCGDWIGLSLLCERLRSIFYTGQVYHETRYNTRGRIVCFLNALSGDTVSSQCLASEDATCSPLCDSLYAAVVLCLGPEQTRVAYNEICTNGYQEAAPPP